MQAKRNATDFDLWKGVTDQREAAKEKELHIYLLLQRDFGLGFMSHTDIVNM